MNNQNVMVILVVIVLCIISLLCVFTGCKFHLYFLLLKLINLFFSDIVFLCFLFIYFCVTQVTYLAVLFLMLHFFNMYTILQTLHKKTEHGGLMLRYKLRAIAYRLSNELAVLVRSRYAYIMITQILDQYK